MLKFPRNPRPNHFSFSTSTIVDNVLKARTFGPETVRKLSSMIERNEIFKESSYKLNRLFLKLSRLGHLDLVKALISKENEGLVCFTLDTLNKSILLATTNYRFNVGQFLTEVKKQSISERGPSYVSYRLNPLSSMDTLAATRSSSLDKLPPLRSNLYSTSSLPTATRKPENVHLASLFVRPLCFDYPGKKLPFIPKRSVRPSRSRRRNECCS